MHTHTYMHFHTCTQTLIHMRTYHHVHTFTYIHTLKHIRSHMLKHTHSATHTHSPSQTSTISHALTHIHIHIHTLVHICTHSHTHTHTLSFTHIYTLTYSDVCTQHIYSHTHFHSHTHIHTYKHIHSLLISLSLSHTHTSPAKTPNSCLGHLLVWEFKTLQAQDTPLQTWRQDLWGLPEVPLGAAIPVPDPGQCSSSPASPYSVAQTGDPNGNFKNRKWLSIQLNLPLSFLAAPHFTFRSQILPLGTCAKYLLHSDPNFITLGSEGSGETEKTHEGLGF